MTPQPSRRFVSLLTLLATLLPGVACTSAQRPPVAAAVRLSDGNLLVRSVTFRGAEGSALHPGRDGGTFTNGIDTFFTKPLSDGGVLVLYRYSPKEPVISTNPYPQLTLPGGSIRYAKPISASPFYRIDSASPTFAFATPYSSIKWPALLSDAGIGIFPVAESPIFEEAIEPFLSAYPSLRGASIGAQTLTVRFDEEGPAPVTVNLQWRAVERTATTTTYVANVPSPSTKAVAIQLRDPSAAQRVWFRSKNVWKRALTEIGGSTDPRLLLVHTDEPSELLVETGAGAPSSAAVSYLQAAGYVVRSRWSAFTVFEGETAQQFFARSMAPSLAAFNELLFRHRDQEPLTQFPEQWRDLLRSVGFTSGKNLLNPEFFNHGFPVAGDPSFGLDPGLQQSVSWATDQAALQAVMGQRLFGWPVDPRYGAGVSVFDNPGDSFYWGSYDRTTGAFASADTGSNDRVVGYNYLLSLTLLTQMIGTSAGLPADEVQRLVDHVLPLLGEGYVVGYPQVPYLWSYPRLAALQWEYGMGKELSEAQLSYVCGLWWLRTHLDRYRDCEISALALPEQYPLTLHGSSFLWGLDVVHGGYVVDALLLAYRTTGEHHYLDAAVSGWRQELLFLFSRLDYPETPFDDRGISVTSFYSTFADLHQGNYWRDDEWNNSRVLWSLSKLLAYVDDPQITWLLAEAEQTQKQSMPVVDAVYTPDQRSDFYGVAIDPKDFELSYEDLRDHYSTQVSYSADVWRQAFIYDSIHATNATVYRIPGSLLTDAGLAYVVGQPGATVDLVIESQDCLFANGRKTTVVHLNAKGIARVPLVPAAG